MKHKYIKPISMLLVIVLLYQQTGLAEACCLRPLALAQRENSIISYFLPGRAHALTIQLPGDTVRRRLIVPLVSTFLIGGVSLLMSVLAGHFCYADPPHQMFYQYLFSILMAMATNVLIDLSGQHVANKEIDIPQTAWLAAIVGTTNGITLYLLYSLIDPCPYMIRVLFAWLYTVGVRIWGAVVLMALHRIPYRGEQSKRARDFTFTSVWKRVYRFFTIRTGVDFVRHCGVQAIATPYGRLLFACLTGGILSIWESYFINRQKKSAEPSPDELTEPLPVAAKRGLSWKIGQIRYEHSQLFDSTVRRPAGMSGNAGKYADLLEINIEPLVRRLVEGGCLSEGATAAHIGTGDGYLLFWINAAVPGVIQAGFENDDRLFPMAQGMGRRLAGCGAIEPERITLVKKAYQECLAELRDFNILFVQAPVPLSPLTGRPIYETPLVGNGGVRNWPDVRRIADKMREGQILVLIGNDSGGILEKRTDLEHISGINAWRKKPSAQIESADEAALRSVLRPKAYIGRHLGKNET